MATPTRCPCMNVPTMWIFRNVSFSQCNRLFHKSRCACRAHQKKRRTPFGGPPEMLRMLHFEKSDRDIILTDSASLP